MVQAPVDPSVEIADRSRLVTRPLALALVGVCLLVIAALVWALFGRAPTTVSGHGILLPQGGYAELGTRAVGIVDRVLVAPGQLVERGDAVVAMRTERGTRALVRARHGGQVIDVPARPGALTGPGEPLVALDPAGVPLQAIGFLPAASADVVEPGMRALIAPSDAPSGQHGAIEGTVVSVAPAPVSRGRLLTLLAENAELADHFLRSGPVGEVTVAMTAADNLSGYTWTIGSGPDRAVDSGTLAEVTVVVEETTVLDRIAR